jgi:hypothetical protein
MYYQSGGELDNFVIESDDEVHGENMHDDNEGFIGAVDTSIDLKHMDENSNVFQVQGATSENQNSNNTGHVIRKSKRKMRRRRRLELKVMNQIQLN